MIPDKIYHSGVPINNINYTTALRECTAIVASINRHKPRQLVTLEVEGYHQAKIDRVFREILEKTALVVPGNAGLRAYSMIVRPLLEKVTGHVIVPDILDWCMEHDKKVVLVGSSPDLRNRAVRKILHSHPSGKIAQITGDYDFKNPTDTAYVQEEIDQSEADFVIYAGNQVEAERWIFDNVIQPELNVRLIGNFGQTINQIAGDIPRPPRIINKMNLDWLYLLKYRTPERRRRFFKEFTTLGRILIQRE